MPFRPFPLPRRPRSHDVTNHHRMRGSDSSSRPKRSEIENEPIFNRITAGDLAKVSDLSVCLRRKNARPNSRSIENRFRLCRSPSFGDSNSSHFQTLSRSRSRPFPVHWIYYLHDHHYLRRKLVMLLLRSPRSSVALRVMQYKIFHFMMFGVRVGQSRVGKAGELETEKKCRSAVMKVQ